MVDLAPGRYVYRPLRGRRDDEKAAGIKPMEGWDVYALQMGLRGFGYMLEPDHILGDKTSQVIWRYQQTHTALEDDGIAGVVTQRHIGLVIAARYRAEEQLPPGMLKGHLEYESSNILGNHTAPYATGAAAGSRDLGCVMCNDRFTSIEVAFDPVIAIGKLAGQVRVNYDKYRAKNVGRERAWALAAGSWNAPAFTNWLAGIRDTSALEPGPTARATLEAYIEAVTAYCPFD